MKGIDSYISELLFDHDCVILPGFGGFLTNYSGARIHPVRHSFHPPARTVVFNANLRTNDGLLIDHVSRSMHITYREASEAVIQFVSRLNADLEKVIQLFFTTLAVAEWGRKKNIIFDPDLGFNYLDDAFGLPSFVSPAIKRETVRKRLEQQLNPRPSAPGKRKNRKLAPVIGWAAGIAIPLTAALFLYFYNPSAITDLGKGYASFVPTIKFSPAEHKDGKYVSTESEYANFRLMPEKPAVTVAETDEPAEALPEPSTATTPTVKTYQIVVGAFSEEINATNYVRQLQAGNYPASIIGTSKQGLYRVSISGHDSRSEAFSMLAKVRENENPSAWLLVIR